MELPFGTLVMLDTSLVSIQRRIGAYISVSHQNGDSIVPPQDIVRIEKLTILLAVDGFARIGLETLKSAIFDAFGDPTDWANNVSPTVPPLMRFEARLDIVPFPGETLEAIAWRLIIAAWRGSRIRPDHPIATIQLRVFTGLGANDEIDHGEWVLGAEDHAALLATFPGTLVY